MEDFQVTLLVLALKNDHFHNLIIDYNCTYFRGAILSLSVSQEKYGFTTG